MTLILITAVVIVLCMCVLAFCIGVTFGADRQDRAYHDRCSRIDEQLDREERERRGEA